MESKTQYNLIMTVVSDGFSERVIQASKKAGAMGGTVLHGRGTEIHEDPKLFGLNIEPEKEVILTLIEKEKTEAVLDAIVQAGELTRPGRGIASVLDVGRATGIGHLNNLKNDK